MGMFWWTSSKGRIEHRRKKEQAALVKLKRYLEGEKGRLTRVEAIIDEMKPHIDDGDFAIAETYVPELLKEMKYKGLIDNLEEHLLKQFKRTMLKEINSEAKKAKKSFK